MPYPSQWDGRTYRVRSAPSKPARLELKILKIFPGRLYDLRIVSSRPVVVETHYDGRRTLPCSGQQGVCWCDHATADTREQNWLTVFDWKEAKHYLLSLTPAAAWGAVEIRDPAVDLRGARMKVGRKGETLGSEMWASVEVGAEFGSKLRLPDEIDVLALLRKMWHAPLVKNCAPERVPFATLVPDHGRGEEAAPAPSSSTRPTTDRDLVKQLAQQVAENFRKGVGQ